MTSLLFLAQDGGILESARATGEQFGFQWTLFLSNCISFLIVCFLLQKFAYKPIMTVLETRRQRIAEGLANAERIKAELADAEAKKAEIIAQANTEAQRMIEEARASAAAIAEKRNQQSIAEAEQIVVKAREATLLEREREFASLKREIGRLVVDTTSKVSGKVLNDDDKRRISEETVSQVAA